MRKKCIDCAHRATDCAQGLMTLPLKELLAWCRDTKKKIGITNNKISEITGIPIGTLERIMAGKVEDAKFSTIQPIVAALLEFTPGVTCPDDDALSAAHLRQRLTELTRIEAEKDKLEQLLAHLREDHAKELETVHKDTQQRTTYLKGQLKKEETRSTRLLRGLIALGVFDILALAIDAMIPTIGFLRY